tara:strand:+ start:3976 stop:4734 length:759 start_codon:yes stop_codon:yes gene_type:complete
MKPFLFSLLFSFIIPLSSINVAMAQFEGEIIYHMIDPSEENSDSSNMLLMFTKNRIYVNTSNDVNMMAGLSTSGILVRNDHQDFVLTIDNNEGLQIARSELENLSSMLNRLQGRTAVQQKPFPWDEKVVETGNSQEIQGYSAQQFILNGDTADEYVSIWLTDQIKVNWGLLLEAWNSTGKYQFDNEIPIEVVMNQTSFPLLIEVYRENEVVFLAETVSINTDQFDRSKVEISSDMKLLSFTDLMMNIFRQQR